MKAPTKNKITIEEDKLEYIALIAVSFDSAFRTLQLLGRTTAVASTADGILLNELAQYVAAKLLEAGQTPDEAEETLLNALEEEAAAYEEEEEDGGGPQRAVNLPIITNPVPEKDVQLKGGFPGSGIDGRDGTQGGEDIGND